MLLQFWGISSYDHIKRVHSESIDIIYTSFTHCHRHSDLQHFNYHLTVKLTASDVANTLSITMHWSLVSKYCQFKVQNSLTGLIVHHDAPYVALQFVYRCTTCLQWHRLGFHYPDYYMERVQHAINQ